MEQGFRITCVDDPDDASVTTIGLGIRSHNEEHAGKNNYRSLCCFLSAPDGSVVGGLVGATYWDWLHIDLFWVREQDRRQGHGHALLMAAEAEARQRGAHDAYLDTFSFQAADFYARHGYEVFGQLPDFPAGHQRYFFRKRL